MTTFLSIFVQTFLGNSVRFFGNHGTKKEESTHCEIWAQTLIGLLATVAILVFAIFFLKKMATHTLTVVFGFVLGASMVPNPKNVDVEAAEFKDPGQNMEVPSAPPSYEVAVQN